MELSFFFIYYFLFRHYPNLSFIGHARKAFGKYLGWIIGLLYTQFFLYISARNVREFGELLLTSTLPTTPLFAINALLVLVICYVLYLGIEVVGRTAEVFIVILFLFGIVGNFLILISGNINLNNLQPFLADGWKPILTTAFPHLIIFPFTELIVFLMLLPYLNRPKAVKKSVVVCLDFIRSYLKLDSKFKYRCSWNRPSGAVHLSFIIYDGYGKYRGIFAAT
nr:GerAB/ArcD/ProY family transporter [Bacillus taeanensis]